MPGTYRTQNHLEPITRQLVRAWIAHEPAHDPVWTPLERPLSECRVALISSAGIALRDDTPFDLQIELDDAWRADETHRVIPSSATTADIRVYHTHINHEPGEQDMNCLLPLDRLHELAQSGEIGAVAPSHYSYIGYTVAPDRLIRETIPAIIGQLKAEAVDAAVLAPA